MTLDEFEKLLKDHDWTYMYSDDMRAWTKGNNSLSKIQFEASKNPVLQSFYEDYKNALSQQKPKPTAKDYVQEVRHE